MSELEPEDSRVVHGNAKPKPGDERFAQSPEEAREPGVSDDKRKDDESTALDDDAVRNPEQAPSKQDRPREKGETGSQHEQSRTGEGQFEASDLDRGEAQYQAEPLIQQQHQSDDWSEQMNRGGSQLEQSQSRTKQSQGKPEETDFETGQADYGGAQRKAERESSGSVKQGDLSDDDIGETAPPQAKTGKEPRD